MSDNLPEIYASRAWLLDGSIRSLPGVLQWTGERLEFVGFGANGFSEKSLAALLESFGHPREQTRVLLDEKPLTVFSALPADFVAYKFPWYSFKKGVNLTLLGKVIRFSLIQPQNTKLPARFVGGGISHFVASRALAKLPAEKADAVEWTRIFDYLSR